MGWTAISGDIDTDRERVRALCGDVKSADKLIDDEYIDWALSREPNVECAAAATCEMIGSQMMREETQSAEGYSSNTERYSRYFKRAKELRAMGATDAPYAGGISKDEWEDWKDDDDVIQPTFTRGQFDNLESDAVCED